MLLIVVHPSNADIDPAPRRHKDPPLIQRRVLRRPLGHDRHCGEHPQRLVEDRLRQGQRAQVLVLHRALPPKDPPNLLIKLLLHLRMRCKEAEGVGERVGGRLVAGKEQDVDVGNQLRVGEGVGGGAQGGEDEGGEDVRAGGEVPTRRSDEVLEVEEELGLRLAELGEPEEGDPEEPGGEEGGGKHALGDLLEGGEEGEGEAGEGRVRLAPVGLESEGRVGDAMECTTKLALHVISNAAFGFKTHWGKPDPPLPGFTLPFFTSLEQISQRMFATSFLPSWLLRVPLFGLPQLGEAKSQFLLYLKHFIASARRDLPARSDIFTSLILSSLGTSSDTLSDAELIANIHILLFAGHETTAHTLTYALGLLAAHPEVQEELYEEIWRVLGGERAVEYEDLRALPLAKAVLNETLRMFPAVTVVPKWAPEDTTLDEGRIFVPAGCRINISVAGMHYNEKHWGPDVEEFKPRRFLGEYPRDAFMPFSDGPRSCIGKRFALIEAQTVLVLLVRKFRIVPAQPDTKDMFESRVSITLTPKRPIVLNFIPRDQKPVN
eukprot:TRINITY_DN18788_c0_g2_i2.p2 TRINITY_DN18788_c0_g2~~TRINITY_DN18788_c0_g2_i2.p2  ORF type:complete len:548 (-),score=69.03 TRINITY_DN18788_c0_g2_i2:63-1706(-)